MHILLGKRNLDPRLAQSLVDPGIESVDNPAPELRVLDPDQNREKQSRISHGRETHGGISISLVEGPLDSLTTMALPMTALGTVTSTLSLVSNRVDRIPISVTTPRVWLSILMYCPTW